MIIVYNGIELGIVTMHEFAYETMYSDDGVDCVGTRVSLHCTAVVNGQVNVRNVAGPPTSYAETGATGPEQQLNAAAVPPGIPGPVAATSLNMAAHPIGAQPLTSPQRLALAPTPVSRFGVYSHDFGTDTRVPLVVRVPGPPITSHVVIRKKLTGPRGVLLVFSGTGVAALGELLLQSPLPGSGCDIRNGPSPKVLNILANHGDGTFLVEFAIETYVKETDPTWFGVDFDAANTGRAAAVNPILSNRFRSRHVLADDQFLEIQVEGRAVFRTDFVYNANENPDAYRLNLFLPVPAFFVRGNISVEGMPDVSGVRYAFVDRQQKVNFPAGPYVAATNIEAVHKQTVVIDQDVLSGVPEISRGVLKGMTDLNFAGLHKPGEDSSLSAALNNLADAIKTMKK